MSNFKREGKGRDYSIKVGSTIYLFIATMDLKNESVLFLSLKANHKLKDLLFFIIRSIHFLKRERKIDAKFIFFF